MIHPPLPGDLGKGSFLETQVMLEPGYYEVLFNDGTMKILQVTKNPKRGYLTTTGERDLLGMDPDALDPKWEQVFRLRPLVAGESVPVPRPKKEENPGVWRLGEIIRASLSLLPAGQPLQRHLLEAAISRTVSACPLLFSKVTLQDQQSLVDELLGQTHSHSLHYALAVNAIYSLVYSRKLGRIPTLQDVREAAREGLGGFPSEIVHEEQIIADVWAQVQKNLCGGNLIGRNVQFEHWIDMGLITGKITAVSTDYYEVTSDKGVRFGVDRARVKFL